MEMKYGKVMENSMIWMCIISMPSYLSKFIYLLLVYGSYTALFLCLNSEIIREISVAQNTNSEVYYYYMHINNNWKATKMTL